MGTGAERYGQYYWCVGLDDADGTEVYFYADEIRFDSGQVVGVMTTDPDEYFPSGGIKSRKPADSETVMLAFAPGQWKFVYAASVMDGHAVAAEHWKGQILD